MFLKAKKWLEDAITAAAERLCAEKGLDSKLGNFTVEVPADRANGDFATNAAMVGAKTFRMAPRALAQLLLDGIDLSGSEFSRAEIAGPGFINFYLAEGFYAKVVRQVLTEGESYGRSDYGKGETVLLEFVSANPTGPAHMGNARGGALGDCLAGAMSACGYEVKREFYVNDAGNQIAKLGLSLEIRYLQRFLGDNAPQMPDDSYHGDDIVAYAAAYAEKYGDKLVNADSKTRRDELVAFALPQNIQKLHDNMEKYRITYDRWYCESELYANGEVERVISLLRASERTYERDGALWFMVGDEPDCPGADSADSDEAPSEDEKVFHKDFVLVRSNGFPTYIVPDIAYHYNKLVTRGFDRAINVWGCDHHGYAKRLKSVLPLVGIDPERLDIIFIQLVKLTRGGEVVRMSKRTGKAVTLTDLLEEIPTDAVRFLFNMRTPESQMEFDMELALQQDSQNPVYYTQYAHARICSILKNLAAEGIKPAPATDGDLSLLTQPDERALIDLLATLPSVIITAARDYDPSGITRYAVELATAFHKFYSTCRVNCGEEALMRARIALCLAVKTALCNILTLLKISAPESM